MRIAYVTADFGVPVLGAKGASVHVRQLVSALCDGGHEVLVVTPTPASGLGEQLGCRVAEIPLAGALPLLYEEMCGEDVARGNRLAKDMRNLLYSVWMEMQAAPILADFRPDFVYERYSLLGTAGLLLARRFDVPLVVEVNAPLVEEQQAQRGLTLARTARAAQRLLFGEADHMVVVSQWLADYAATQGADPSRVTVVPNAADPFLFCPRPEPSEIRRRLGWEERCVLGFVGSMKDWHGVATLIDALEHLRDQDDFVLLLVGAGPQLASLQAQVEERGLSERVHFAGEVAHETVPDWIGAVDVALAPYAPTAEAYFSPVKLFEYMSMARPVVAARVGQTAELIEPGRTGWLYTPGDAADLAERLRWLHGHRAEAAAAGTAAREFVLARHTWRHNAERVVELAQAAASGRFETAASRLHFRYASHRN